MEVDYRLEFPVTKQWSFLNHAAVAPLTMRARERITEWANDVAENGNVHEAKWWGEMETLRSAAARLIHAESKEIALLKNTSEGLALIAEGFPWQPGDNVVIPQGEYPANVYPWMHLQSKGVDVKTVPCRGVRVEIEDLGAAIDDRTRLISISHVQYATGFRSDLEAIGRLCRDRKIDFCVDAIQGLGVFPIDVKACQIDYLAADGHKWLLGPEGAAICYISIDKLEKIRATSVGWKSVVGWTDFSTIDYTLKPDASRYEGGTYHIPGLLGLNASLSLIEEVGVPIIMERVKSITGELVDRLADIGAKVISSRKQAEWSGILSFQIPGKDPREIHRKCKERNVVIAVRDGRLRASPHFYNNSEDVEQLISVLAE